MKAAATVIHALAALNLSLVDRANAQQQQPAGPGAGPWSTAAPEDYGLADWALVLADELIAEYVGARDCFIVVKGGQIVYENYRLGRQPETVGNKIWRHNDDSGFDCYSHCGSILLD